MTDDLEVQADPTEVAPELPPLETPEAAPPPEEPKPEPVSGKLGTLLRREQQFQAKVKAEKEKLGAERQKFETERAELETMRARYAKVNEDPIEGLKATGLSYEELTRKILASNTPEAKIDALQKKLEMLEQSRETEQREYQKQIADRQVESGKELYKSHIFGNEDKYPTLTLYDEAEVREAAWNIATSYYTKTQIAPDAEEVAQYLENQAALRFKAMEERRTKRVAPPVGALPSKTGAKTLTASKIAERSAPPMAVDYHKMTEEEQREHDAAYLAKHLWKD